MVFRVLEIADYIRYREPLIGLLSDSYGYNFSFTKDQNDYIANEKIESLKAYINDNSAIVIGAFLNGKLAGFIWLFKYNFFYETRLHINQIVVDNDHRGKGIGKLLMQEAEKQARQLGVETIDLFVSEKNYRALQMYANIGFKTERRLLKKDMGGNIDVNNN